MQPGDIRSILSAARPAVVRIDVGNNGQTQATGTGFIVDSSGVIVTNNHVVEGFNTVTVHTAAGDEMQGKVVGADATLDLAVVKVDKTGLPTLQLGDSDTLQVGDGVVAIGNALGLSEGSGATVTTGIISGLDRVVEVGNETLFNAIQTDAAINPGNSGGPLRRRERPCDRHQHRDREPRHVEQRRLRDLDLLGQARHRRTARGQEADRSRSSVSRASL